MREQEKAIGAQSPNSEHQKPQKITTKQLII